MAFRKAALMSFLFSGAWAQVPSHIHGVAKTTYSASDPWTGLGFVLKYLPATATMDSCTANYCKTSRGVTIMGRAQLVEAGYFKAANCKLYSSIPGNHTESSGTTSLVPSTSLGSDCKYHRGRKYTDDTSLMWVTFAHDQDTCCKACVATKGCATAAYLGSSVGRRLQPSPSEGFGLHLVNVSGSPTTGGIDVDALEKHFATRLNDMTAFDQFMDYNVQLFTANLSAYAKRFHADNVPTFAASWTAEDTSDTWYSLFVHVPKSQMVIELVGRQNPIGDGSAPLTQLEARMSSRNVKLFSTYKPDDLNVLYPASVSRAASNISVIEKFYTEIIKATAVQTIDAGGVSRRCYAWTTDSKSDVCYTSRSSEAPKDAEFSVTDFERMLWNVHATNIKSAPGGDKYQDNHYAMDLEVSGDYLSEYFKAHNPFPLSTQSWFAYCCTQSYIIDPAGWTIQVDLLFKTQYPGCGGPTPKDVIV